jgi:hypothetical protein
MCDQATNINKIKTKKDKNKNKQKNKNNIIRQISNFLNDKYNIKYLKYTSLYSHIHNLFIFLLSFILLFNCNIYHLLVLLCIVSLDAFSIVVLHECPLTRLEEKYSNISIFKERLKLIKSAEIVYNCNHKYEQQIELLINVWLLVAGKCACILFLNTFNLKLCNSNGIYA